jgi:ADP-heptose:LPS heptosyltransferase
MQHDAAAYFAHHLGLLDQTSLESMPSTKSPFPLSPLYQVEPDDLAQAWLAFPRHEGRARIGIQTESSVKNRTYPVDLTADLIKTLIEEDGADVFTFGYPAPKQVQIPHFYPLQCMDPAPSLTQSAAVLATMDAVIAPDSALCHIAGALGLPTIALYGPFHWRQRTGQMPSVKALQGHAECAPCQWHLTKGQHYPPHMPCSRLVGPPGQQRQAGCKALANIPPERIRKELWKHLQTSVNNVNQVNEVNPV